DCGFVGTGQVARLVPPAILSTIVNLGVSIALTLRCGIIGPLLGTLTASLCINGWYLPWLLKRHFGISLRALASAVTAPLAFGLPFWVCIWWLAQAYPPRSWLELAMQMAVSGLLFLTLAWLVIFKAEERAVWIVRFRSLVRSSPSV